MLNRRVASLSLLAALCGCASSVPRDPVYVGAAERRVDAGTVVFYRTNSIYGAGLRPDIRLDGQYVGHSATGSMFRALVAPGKHRVSIDPTGPGGGSGTSFDVNVGPLATVYVRTWVGGLAWVGNLSYEQVDAAEAREHIKSLTAAN